MKIISIIMSILLLASARIFSQNYHAIQGSSYAGSLGIANNPSSIVNTPYAWDITLASAQYKTSTNIITVVQYSLLSSPKQSKYLVNNGDYARYANANFNIHLLNARIAINRQQAVGFGVNLRGYGRVRTDKYNFMDTLPNVRSFFMINEHTSSMEGNFAGSSWLEFFGTYAHTLFDTETGRLNAGITVKATRGISGAFASLENARVEKTIQDDHVAYLAKSGDLQYGYSSNFDNWKEDKSTRQNINEVLSNGEPGVSIDLGIEYLVKSQEVPNYYDEDSHYDYEWKIGLALLDIGRNQFGYGRNSSSFSNPKDNISDEILQDKFVAVDDSDELNDSLSSIANTVSPFSGKFSVIHPARMVVNVDRYLFNDFYLNGELSLNLSSLAANNRRYNSEMNMITLTPRWETRRWGVYLPMQYNTEGQFWIGGAFKAGPLVAGVHNLGNVFLKNKMHNGGAYVALVIRPMNLTKAYRDRRLDCPEPGVGSR